MPASVQKAGTVMLDGEAVLPPDTCAGATSHCATTADTMDPSFVYCDLLANADSIGTAEGNAWIGHRVPAAETIQMLTDTDILIHCVAAVAALLFGKELQQPVNVAGISRATSTSSRRFCPSHLYQLMGAHCVSARRSQQCSVIAVWQSDDIRW